jgi:hypothetical protein
MVVYSIHCRVSRCCVVASDFVMYTLNRLCCLIFIKKAVCIIWCRYLAPPFWKKVLHPKYHIKNHMSNRSTILSSWTNKWYVLKIAILNFNFFLITYSFLVPCACSPSRPCRLDNRSGISLAGGHTNDHEGRQLPDGGIIYIRILCTFCADWSRSSCTPPFRNIRCFSFVKLMYLDIF